MTGSDPMRVIIAGGGTGGHLFPGIAMAEAFIEKAPDAEVLFVGSEKSFEKAAVEAAGFTHRAVAVEGLKGRGLLNQARALVKLFVSIITAFGILVRFKPQLVLGVGGYASAPCVIAAFFLRVKTAIQEQNLAPGLTNQVLGRLAGRIYVSFAQTMENFNEKKVRVFGNPVRKSLTIQTSDNLENSEKTKYFTVLVLGGSQGAHGINEAVTAALPGLREPGKFAFIHQTGEKDIVEITRAYKFWGGPSDVRAFFNDMEIQYALADLVICRAGASTVAELTALGKAAVFVPFAFAADNHQERNARALEQAGAAEVILENALSGSLVTKRLAYYEANRELIAIMEKKAKALGRPHAARDIVEDILSWITKN